MDEGYMGMISNDPSAPANMPQNVIQKEYPKGDFTSYNLDDSISEIDSNNKNNISKVNGNKSKSMY